MRFEERCPVPGPTERLSEYRYVSGHILVDNDVQAADLADQLEEVPKVGLFQVEVD